MAIEGTRYATTVRPANSGSRSFDRAYSRDLGLAPNVLSQIITFGGGSASAAGAFGAFQAGETVLIEGTNLNNGEFNVLAQTADALTLDPPPVAETAMSCTIRTTRNVPTIIVPPVNPSGEHFLLGGYRMLLGGQPATI